MTALSVICPVYNQGQYLAACLESVLRQTVRDWECIIVDDGSTDNCKDIVSRYLSNDYRFVYVYQENQGVSSARNHGLQLARGEYVAFLDADDMLKPHMSEVLMRKLKGDGGIGVAYGGYEIVTNDGTFVRNVHPPNYARSRLIERMLVSNLFPVHAAMVRGTTIRKTGAKFLVGTRVEDWAFWFELALSGVGFSAVREVVCSYRGQHEGRSSQVFENVVDSEKFLDQSVRRLIERRNLPNCLRDTAFLALYMRHYVKAIKCGDEEGRIYCKDKLANAKGVGLVAGGSHRVYILGLYLDIQEKTREHPWLEPMVLARKVWRISVSWWRTRAKVETHGSGGMYC